MSQFALVLLWRRI